MKIREEIDWSKLGTVRLTEKSTICDTLNINFPSTPRFSLLNFVPIKVAIGNKGVTLAQGYTLEEGYTLTLNLGPLQDLKELYIIGPEGTVLDWVACKDTEVTYGVVKIPFSKSKLNSRHFSRYI